MGRRSEKRKGKKNGKDVLRHVGEGVAARRKVFEKHVAEALDNLARQNALLREEGASSRRTVQELVRASNAAAILLACVERVLDAKWPGWDEGERERVRQRSELLRERSRVLLEAQRLPRSEETRSARLAAARRIWELAGENGTRELDVVAVLALHVQAGDLEGATAFLREVRAAELKLSPEIEEVIAEIEARVAGLADAPGTPPAPSTPNCGLALPPERRVVTPGDPDWPGA